MIFKIKIVNKSESENFLTENVTLSTIFKCCSSFEFFNAFMKNWGKIIFLHIKKGGRN